MALLSKKRTLWVLTVNICRFVMALVLIMSGFVKAVDPVGAMYKLQEYMASFSIDAFSDDWLLFFAIMQAALELLLGIFLLVGVYRKAVPLLTLVVMAVFTPFTLYILLSGKVSDCGCFGDAFVLANSVTFFKNLFLLLLSVVVFCGRRSFVWYVSRRTRWMIAIFSLLYVSLLQGMSLSHLPVVDFRPYAVGNDLRAMTQGVPASYEVVLTYEKNGEKRDFALDSLPDNTWTKVDSRSVMVDEGVPALIGDFAIIDWEYDYDVAEEILADTGYVCLVVIEAVEKASVSRVDKINDLYDHCYDKSIPFYAVSSSGDSEIALWRKRTGAEYPVYWAEESMLRTMLRANPGLVLLKDGVVVGKWNASDIPDVESFENSPSMMPDNAASPESSMRGWAFWMQWLFGPLLFFVAIDILLCRLKRRKGSASAADVAQLCSR